ncbi:MAG: BamA/TamA family outer membrane protein [Gemmatimonadota bacterium]|nr:MAG: BamA/TamA family outer membrane protein [Gemmatimonadota bacterium]
MRPALVAFLALAAVIDSSTAQQITPNLPKLGSSWTDVGYPKIYWTPANGASFGLYYAQLRPPGFNDWDDAPPYRANISIDGEISTSGSYRLGLEFKFPSFFPGWRFDLRFRTTRLARQNYFGIGNETAFDNNKVTDAQPYYYKMDRRRLFLRGTAQRQLFSRLRALAGFHLEGWQLDTLRGPSLLGEQTQAGLGPPIGSRTWQVNLRLGLVFDSRDDEVTPRRGALIEALFDGADSTIVGDVSYARFTAAAAAFQSVGERLTLGARVVGQAMSGSPPVGTYFTIEASERAYHGLGGSSSHRGLATGRFLAQDKLFANLDARFLLGGQRQVVTVDLLGFIDVGRVFQPGDDFTLARLHVGAGLGPMITIGRNGIIGWTFAWGPDQLQVHTLTSWTF